MERESLLTVLIIVLAGMALQLCAAWPSPARKTASAAELEHRTWVHIWLPSLPALVVAAWLCGWALAEPDPVPDRLDRAVLIAVCAPFAFVFARAAARAAWSLLREPIDRGVSTVGLIRPRVVVSPFLARQLDERALRAALEHERAHARHRDPLRIWLAQLLTDLQWPSPSARERLEIWLSALEHARDDEARAAGVGGADLASALLASVRFLRGSGTALPEVRATAARAAETGLIGEPSALRARVSRLLEPLSEPAHDGRASAGPTSARIGLLLIPAVLSALALGVLFGERLVQALLALT